MNRYPLWKYLTVAIALVLGFIYTLPNFFGESPAVQVSSAKATIKVDDKTLARAETALKAAGIAHDGIQLDFNGVKTRFKDTDTQLKAKDTLEKAFNPDAADPQYVVALNLLTASPAWLTGLHALPMYLGLDLRGGVHFLLQVDMKGALTKRLDSTGADLRTLMRDKNLRHAGIGREGDRLVVKFREAEVRDKARNAIADSQRGREQNNQEKGFSQPVRQQDTTRLGCGGTIHQGHDLRKTCIPSHGARTYLHRRTQIVATREDGCPGAAAHRMRFTRKNGFIDQCLAEFHHTIGHERLARVHAQQVTGKHTPCGNALKTTLAIGALHALGQTIEQCVNGTRGLVAQAQLQESPTQQKEDKHGEGVEIHLLAKNALGIKRTRRAHSKRDGHTQSHRQVHTDTQAGQVAPSVAKKRAARKQHDR